MPTRHAKGSINESTLLSWRRTYEAAPGYEIARARLDYMDLEGTSRFLRGLSGQSRVRPRVLVTAQVSGRWSTSNPPLVGLPKPIRGILRPDYETYWLCMDMDSIEARLAATYAQEHRDLDVFSRGEDIHAATALDIFGEGSPQDGQRQIAKTTRYNLQYAYDYRGILEAKDFAIFGGRQRALEFARKFLASRPALTSTKQRVFAESLRTHQARSAFGRLRRLTGDAKTQAKDGWSHTIQATVSGMMNRLIPKWLALHDGARIVLNQHDGCILSFPARVPAAEMLVACQRIAGEPWNLWGHKMAAPTTWEVIQHGTNAETPEDPLHRYLGARV